MYVDDHQIYHTGRDQSSVKSMLKESAQQATNWFFNLSQEVSLDTLIKFHHQYHHHAMKSTYQFVKGTDSHYACSQEAIRTLARNETVKHSLSPAVSLIRPADSGSSVLGGSLLKVAGIPAISYAAMSEELSSPFYKTSFITVPSDKQRASAMADLFEHFDWSHVATVAVDDSYGRYGVWALEKESFPRKSFCIALNTFVQTT
ncbi:Extracellular calcium-sensing receptor [Stylophora pistillata]|uniref:Extracellular calcium-sensing receptor n=1 Tax=Stylophora pistillata TaxID=50429 RepID=A0A2B4T264_STYPI|nr:Extracellular calcium-sensing receptor [Stylophora pistillata]